MRVALGVLLTACVTTTYPRIALAPLQEPPLGLSADVALKERLVDALSDDVVDERGSKIRVAIGVALADALPALCQSTFAQVTPLKNTDQTRSAVLVEAFEVSMRPWAGNTVQASAVFFTSRPGEAHRTFEYTEQTQTSAEPPVKALERVLERFRADLRTQLLAPAVPQEALTQRDVMYEVRRAVPDIQRCVIGQRERMPRLTGKLVMRWRILTTGDVVEPTVISHELDGTYIAQCIAETIKGWKFPPTTLEGAPVVFPFKF